MLVEQMLSTAREKLVTISDAAPLIEAARLLRKGTDIVVACDRSGRLAGVVTPGDVVARISECQGASCVTGIAMVMSRNVETCHPADDLEAIWGRMKQHGLKNFPVIDEERWPLGVLNARDALDMLLQEAEDEEALLRDYVVGIGYR